MGIGTSCLWGDAKAASMAVSGKTLREKEIEMGKKMVEDSGIRPKDVLQYTITSPCNPKEGTITIRRTGGGGSRYGPCDWSTGFESPVEEHRRVNMCIARDFPDDVENYGRLVISVISSPIGLSSSPIGLHNSTKSSYFSEPKVIPCAGRGYVEVSREVNLEVKRSNATGTKAVICVVFEPTSSSVTNGFGNPRGSSWRRSGTIPKVKSSARGTGRRTYFISSDSKQGNKAVRDVIIAWCVTIDGITSSSMTHIPVIWRKTPLAAKGKYPNPRVRKHGAEDDVECASDYSEQSTTPSTIMGERGHYDAIRRAPLPTEGYMTTPSRFNVGFSGERTSASSVRAIRPVDIRLCHPLMQPWIENCLVEVGVMIPSGETNTHTLNTFADRYVNTEAPLPAQRISSRDSGVFEAVAIDLTTLEQFQEDDIDVVHQKRSLREQGAGGEEVRDEDDYLDTAAAGYIYKEEDAYESTGEEEEEEEEDAPIVFPGNPKERSTRRKNAQKRKTFDTTDVLKLLQQDSVLPRSGSSRRKLRQWDRDAEYIKHKPKNLHSATSGGRAPPPSSFYASSSDGAFNEDDDDSESFSSSDSESSWDASEEHGDRLPRVGTSVSEVGERVSVATSSSGRQRISKWNLMALSRRKREDQLGKDSLKKEHKSRHKKMALLKQSAKFIDPIIPSVHEADTNSSHTTRRRRPLEEGHHSSREERRPSRDRRRWTEPLGRGTECLGRGAEPLGVRSDRRAMSRDELTKGPLTNSPRRLPRFGRKTRSSRRSEPRQRSMKSKGASGGRLNRLGSMTLRAPEVASRERMAPDDTQAK